MGVFGRALVTLGKVWLALAGLGIVAGLLGLAWVAVAGLPQDSAMFPGVLMMAALMYGSFGLVPLLLGLVLRSGSREPGGD